VAPAASRSPTAVSECKGEDWAGIGPTSSVTIHCVELICCTLATKFKAAAASSLAPECLLHAPANGLAIRAASRRFPTQPGGVERGRNTHDARQNGFPQCTLLGD
jgi:hypothetical protein